jgi:hypothetical protein
MRIIPTAFSHSSALQNHTTKIIGNLDIKLLGIFRNLTLMFHAYCERRVSFKRNLSCPKLSCETTTKDRKVKINVRFFSCPSLFNIN